MIHSRWRRSILFVAHAAVALYAASSLPGQSLTHAPVVRPSEAKSSPIDPQENYRIGPGDVLAINVWKEPELSRTMPVRPDGKISLPVIGETLAAGLTATQLQTQLGQKLGDYVRNPQINVIVQEIKSRSFNVMGRVAKPGSFELSKPVTVLDAIALAGGFRDYAHLTKIYVLRRAASGSQTMLPFNYKRVIRGGHPEQNVELQPGDTVVVP